MLNFLAILTCFKEYY